MTCYLGGCNSSSSSSRSSISNGNSSGIINSSAIMAVSRLAVRTGFISAQSAGFASYMRPTSSPPSLKEPSSDGWRQLHCPSSCHALQTSNWAQGSRRDSRAVSGLRVQELAGNCRHECKTITNLWSYLRAAGA
jgi:hypothetical protein